MMTSLYTENSEKWKLLAEIDYFTQFVKAWIPFNAWYKNYYPNLRTDREAINDIKLNPNKFRDRLLHLLTTQNPDGRIFRSYIAQLHRELERTSIYDHRQKKLLFQDICLEQNSRSHNTFTRQNIVFEARKTTNFELSVTNTKGTRTFHFTQTKFDIDAIRSQSDFTKLSTPQQKMLIECYAEIDPYKAINLLTNNELDSIEMDGIHFVKNTEQLCKGIIEILYTLRNALFHGKIIPDKDTNKVYQPAYHILYMLVQAL